MNLNKRTSIALAILATAVLVSPAAYAQSQSLGALATNLSTSTISPLANFLASVAFFMGIVVAFVGLMKFRAHSANPNDPSAKLSSAIPLVAVGAAMIAIPTLLGVGVTTIFGDGAQTTSIGGTLQSLGG